jgi:2-methylisocitrate lyase-like PEP mutase family enzyme
MKDPKILRKQLKDRIALDKPLVLPGAGDALGARLVEQAGFEAAYMSGYAVEGTHGMPDVGLLGLSEVVGRAATLTNVLSIPLVCDADTGYGGAINVIRTVREFERAGVSAIQLEDQDFPKKCGSMSGRRLVSKREMCGKIRAALDARRDENFQIIGRTDAFAVEGADHALERLHAYAEAGADLTMVLGPYEVSDVARFGREVRKPLAYLSSESFTMPMIPVAELHKMGIKVVIFPLALLFTATRAMQKTLEHIRKHGATLDIFEENMVSWEEFNEITGFKEIQEFESQFVPSLPSTGK